MSVNLIIIPKFFCVEKFGFSYCTIFITLLKSNFKLDFLSDDVTKFVREDYACLIYG